ANNSTSASTITVNENSVGRRRKDFTCKTPLHSTTHIRYHLTSIHKKYDLLTNPSAKSSKSLVSENLKRELHTLCYSAIVKDGRSFSDFRKDGILTIFNRLCPDYIRRQNNSACADAK
ncbi:unnamed protein product, partial [Didymodactylos carnosus]